MHTCSRQGALLTMQVIVVDVVLYVLG